MHRSDSNIPDIPRLMSIEYSLSTPKSSGRFDLAVSALYLPVIERLIEFNQVDFFGW